MDINDPIKTTVEEIRKILNIENVIGETIETDEFLLLPVTRMGMGFGAGEGEGKGSDNMSGAAAGAGGAAGVEPIAMVVVHKGVKGPEGVRVMSLQNPDPLSRAIGEISTAAVEIMNQGSKMMHEKGKVKGHVKGKDKGKDTKEAEIELKKE